MEGSFEMVEIKIDFLCDLIICMENDLIFLAIAREREIFMFNNRSLLKFSHDVACRLWILFFERSCTFEFLAWTI